ncbi:MAG: glycosyltransferase family 4 protein [Sphingomonadaceae bacterium]|nr:glycosyltransferase family 4 protein [Sphingomonadaceae bacterium]
MRRRLLLTADAIGGVWTYALDLAAALIPLGWEAVVALLGPAADAGQRAAAARAGVKLVDTGLPLDWLAADAAEARRTAAALGRLARRERVDLVQVNQPALAGCDAGVPVIAAIHSCVATWWAAVRSGPLPDGFGWQAALTRDGLAAADAVVTPTAAFAGAVRAAYGVAAHVVANGRRPAGTPPRPMTDTVLTAGRLWDEGKDTATLDRAAGRLAVPFLAAGPLVGPQGDVFTPGNLHALGRLDAGGLAARLAARPVFASAAVYEPFGLAVLEAAQAGCALVLSDIATHRELWDGAAVFVRPGDDAGFATAIARLIGDAAARRAAGTRAAERAARFTAGAMADGMAAVYRAASGHPVVARGPARAAA